MSGQENEFIRPLFGRVILSFKKLDILCPLKYNPVFDSKKRVKPSEARLNSGHRRVFMLYKMCVSSLCLRHILKYFMVHGL